MAKMCNKSAICIFILGFTLISANLVTEERTNRILDGRVAAEGQFPYAVSIQMLGTPQQLETRGHRCGGALISLSHVVTAASCLYDYNIAGSPPELITPSQYRVFAGANLLTNDTLSDRIRLISNFTIHPDYTGPPALANNIAVLTLQSPFAAAVVRPLSLPASNFNPADFTLCNVTGWGGNNLTVAASTQLRFATKYIYSQNLCTTIFNVVPGVKNILPTMVCAVSYDLLSSNCFGDDGNALVCGGTFTGVLSLSDGCTASTLPEVYTRVSNYTTWLRNVTGSASGIFSRDIFGLIGLLAIIQLLYLTL